jgi:hypothetical protein
LFWVVELQADNIHISNDGRRASMHAEDVPVIDTFQFGGSNNVPAKVSFTTEWEAIGRPELLGKGTKVAPTDPASFLGEFAPAFAKGSFSGRELAFSFTSDPGASSKGGYAEVGRERNGVFLSST